jgi:flagellar protein FliO/FliZ
MTLASIPRVLAVLLTAALVAPAAALAADGEKTPLNLGTPEKATEVAGGPGGGGLVRTIVGLAVVIGVIYGLYWVLKQVKASREERSSGSGLHSLATLPLGTNRALHIVRAGDEVVLVGAGGAGKSTACANLASAYAGAGATVAVVALRAPDGGRPLAARLEPLGAIVLAAPDANAVRERLAAWRPTLTLIDAPAARSAEEVAALAADLRALGAGEVHLAVPATLSASAAAELTDAMAPAGPTHLVLTTPTRPAARAPRSSWR